MGSYSVLIMGGFNASSTKSHVALEDLLLFAKEDLVTGQEEQNGETFTTYRFVTSARDARNRMDQRGLDTAACRALFEELRADELDLVRVSEEGGQLVTSSECVPNPVGFDRYLEYLRATMGTRRCRDVGLNGGRVGDLIVEGSHGAFEVEEDDLFTDDAGTHFDEARRCVRLRCLLEVLPDSAEVELDFTELVDAGRISGLEVAGLFDQYMRIVSRRLELAHRLYGFAIENDPCLDSRLRERISRLNENALIDHVLIPLLARMGCEHLRRVECHGHGEFGADILPFRQTTQFGTHEYWALQAKASDIHGTSSRAGNAGELLSQVMQAFHVTFIDPLDNQRKRIDRFVIASSGRISADARRVIEEGIEGDRRIVFLDLSRITELVRHHRLVQHVLLSEPRSGGSRRSGHSRARSH